MNLLVNCILIYWDDKGTKYSLWIYQARFCNLSEYCVCNKTSDLVVHLEYILTEIGL